MNENDRRHLLAAEGWLELGDHISAFAELEHIAPMDRSHVDVLKLRWRIYAAAGKWFQAFELAEGLTRLLPDELEPFMWRSDSARRMEGGGLFHAFELLQDSVRDFPDEPLVSFTLACYACQLGEMAEARRWLHVAFEVSERNGTERHWKLRAIEEEDLGPLRVDGGWG